MTSPREIGARWGGLLGALVERLTAAESDEERDELTAQVLYCLDTLCWFCAPALSWESETAMRDGPDWCGDWGDPNQVATLRFGIAALLDRLPHVLPPGVELELSLTLRELNRGDVRPLAKPRKGRKGASFEEQRRRELLGEFFWMRHDPSLENLAPTVEHFALLTGLDPSAIYAAAKAVPEANRFFLRKAATWRAEGVLVEAQGEPPPEVTDANIARLGELMRKKVREP